MRENVHIVVDVVVRVSILEREHLIRLENEVLESKALTEF
jgi:hypothetical protein